MATRAVTVEQLGGFEARFLPEPKPDLSITRHVTLFTLERPLELDLGGLLAPVRIAFETYGELNAAGDNAVVVCHALTGSASLAGPSGWWPSAVGPGRLLDPARDFIVCSNVLGGCYGTTGPTSPDPRSGRDYGPDFPEVTLGDMVRVQAELLEHLGVRRVRAVVGGSMGGMQALQWLDSFPERVGSAVVIGAPAAHAAWALAFNHLARTAITGDPDFRGGRYAVQPQGLALARGIATLSYRSPESFDLTQGRKQSPVDEGRFAMSTYLDYQGDKLLRRFDANTYLTISRAMDRFDLRNALPTIENPVLCVGISSDLLYLPGEVRAVAEALPRGEYWELESPHGHDAFLIEADRLFPRVRAFLEGNH